MGRLDQMTQNINFPIARTPHFPILALPISRFPVSLVHNFPVPQMNGKSGKREIRREKGNQSFPSLTLQEQGWGHRKSTSTPPEQKLNMKKEA